ncbi:5'/3'-nucleotidase SurE [Rhodococcus globerulus]|jgi:5'-nucleotidase|uniref:5'/3'-nucleotidase SurE n=1 Tax=Rhodococcus globerulus TaxID=33008 RepID=UPI001F31956C|nr:5'/3'-nucleotidase SurE [Rhodococcus globerulus]MCE4268405.1 5'/3'-nucleotidase SurE [Rhodococcus globerulus]
MRILATNDDGIAAVGLAVLSAAVGSDGHDVIVVAPSLEFSGSSSSLGIVKDESRVLLTTHDPRRFNAVEAYSLNAPPALGVRAACNGSFGPRPDLVVSGINPGHNTGRLVVHSGTVGAAVTAAALDICSVAFSTDANAVDGLQSTADVARCITRGLIATGLPAVAINVNVPDLPIVGISGLSFASLGSKSTDDVAIEIADGSLVLRRRRNASPYDVGSDAAALATGRIAITILELPWSTTDTDNDVIAAIESSWLEFTRAGQRFASKSIEPDCDVSSRVSN